MKDPEIKRTDGMKTNELNDEGSQQQDLTTVPANIPANDVFASYIFTTSNRKLNKYGERLLMEVIFVAQEYVYDLAIGNNKLNFSEKYNEKFAIVDIPVKNLLDYDDTTNYTKAKDAAVQLMKIYHTVESPILDDEGKQMTYKDGSPQYKFESYHLLDKVTINEKPGIVSVKLGEETWARILDMGKGFTRYNLITAKNLDNVNAIRLFQIMSNTSEPLRFSLEKIKGILGLKDKYPNNPSGFIRQVIKPAEREIKEKCPFEIEHELEQISNKKKGHPAISYITFFKKPKASIIQDPAMILGPEIINILKKFDFDDNGIRGNVKLFRQLKDANVDIETFLNSKKEKASQTDNPQGYMIRCLQNLVGFKMIAPVVTSTKKKEAIPTSPKKTPVNPAVKSVKSRKSRLEVNNADAFGDSELEEL